jgi:hypothetical protein
LTIRKWESVLTTKTRRMVASGSERMVPPPPMPALLKRMVGLPWAVRTAEAKDLMLSVVVTSPL